MQPDEGGWLDWLEGYDISVEKLGRRRYDLSVAIDINVSETGWTDISILYKRVEQAIAVLQEESHRQYEELNHLVQPAFETVELGHRPLPPQVDLVRVQIQSRAMEIIGSIFLLERPEPLSWQRLSIIYAGDRKARVVWSEDGTRAFIFSNALDHGFFESGTYEFIFHFVYGGSKAADLLPVYINGGLPKNAEQISWAVNL